MRGGGGGAKELSHCTLRAKVREAEGEGQVRGPHVRDGEGWETCRGRVWGREGAQANPSPCTDRRLTL